MRFLYKNRLNILYTIPDMQKYPRNWYKNQRLPQNTEDADRIQFSNASTSTPYSFRSMTMVFFKTPSWLFR